MDNDQVLLVKKRYFGLYPEYTFENFVVHEGNLFANSVAQCIASGEDVYNPLYIYGDTGTGKTHLLNAIGNYIVENCSDCKVRRISSQDFRDDAIVDFRNRQHETRKKYEDIDFFLMDDVDEVADSDVTVSELLRLFDFLYMNGKKIVLTTKKPPQKLTPREHRKLSRLGLGLIVEVEMPNLAAVRNIVRKKAEESRIVLKMDVINYIAGKCVDNIYGIEAAIKKIVAYQKTYKTEVKLEMLNKVLKDIID